MEPPTKRGRFVDYRTLSAQGAIPTYFAQCYPANAIAQMIQGPERVSPTKRTLAVHLRPKYRPMKDPIFRYDFERRTAEDLVRVLRGGQIFENRQSAAMFSDLTLDSVHLRGRAVPIKGASRLTETRQEFVLDLDLPAYDAVRHCGCKAACKQCWLFVEMASLALELRTGMLYPDRGGVPGQVRTRYMWTFSGKKGVHGWATDPSMDSLSTQARGSIVKYFTQIPDATQPMLPLERTYMETVYAAFLTRASCPTRHYFASKLVQEGMIVMLEKRGARIFARALREAWARVSTTPASGTPDVYMEAWKSQTRSLRPATLERVKFVVVYDLLRPRLDEPVSASVDKHLLKMPFSVHSSTFTIDLPLATTYLGDDGELPRVYVNDVVHKTNATATARFELALQLFERWLEARDMCQAGYRAGPNDSSTEEFT